ncbi:hypothetical protein CH267_10485 [Rhodococcus sp. 06-621-2]|nr:hypothetical protein [Rhodococcus sp. 06-621-2]OZC56593.1 hypothetical protein CH267_10485 [Rhodococcus sp. 06-621-2]
MDARERKPRAQRLGKGFELGAGASRTSLKLASEIALTAQRRVDIPVRRSFVRDPNGAGNTPLARLVATRGRGNAVAIKLYLALIWRCAAPPFDTEIPPRKWAELLSLDDPDGAGKKRISDAFKTLEGERLVTITPNPGSSSTIALCEESGSGANYSLPSSSYVAGGQDRDRHLYFKVPTRLWTSGSIQMLSAPALAVLLAVLATQEAPGKDVWWSVAFFDEQFGLRPATRARGTSELIDAGLLKVRKTRVGESNFSTREFSRERVRNVYKLTGPAGPVPVRKKPRKGLPQRAAGMRKST